MRRLQLSTLHYGIVNELKGHVERRPWHYACVATRKGKTARRLPTVAEQPRVHQSNITLESLEDYGG